MPEANFMAKVSEIQLRDQIPRFEAMTKARREFPAEFSVYQDQAPLVIDAPKPDAAQLAKSAARDAFDDLARQIAEKEGLDMASAMTAARRRYVDKFEAAYA